MPLFRKKPVVIEAIKFQYTSKCIEELKAWMGSSFGAVNKFRSPLAKGELEIITLEDGKDHFTAKHVATEGDWIIKGVKGEFYPCKPDIFEETYEPSS